MPRTDERGGPRTKARISEIATEVFLERGFDAATVADVAKAAGVSSVTVFKYFPRKEDLFLDRTPEAADFLRVAIRDRASGVAVVDALCSLLRRLADEDNALSGLKEHSALFFRTVAASPALLARAREIAGELEAILVSELATDAHFDGDGELLAAFFIAGAALLLTETARRVAAGEDADLIRTEHLARIDALQAALRSGVVAG